MSFKTKALWLILAFTVLRGILAFTMSLGIDESYYWTYSQYLKWNYFDHPPMVAVFIRVATLNLLFDHIEGFVRLGAVLGGALSSWFIYKTCETLHSQKAGFYGACLYNISFYTAITAGLFIMPDSPQMVFYTLSIWLISRINVDPEKWMNWLMFGIASGLCIMSKVHGVFIWFGLGLFIVFYKRSWLKLPQLYVALVVVMIVTSPILIWNIQNNFIAYTFHSNRIVVDDSMNLYSLAGELLSQVLYNNLFTVLLSFIALMAFVKTRASRSGPLIIFNLVGLPLAILLLVVSLYRDTTLPHWSGPAYVALIPLAAIHLATYQKKYLLLLVKTGFITFLMVVVAGKFALHLYPGVFGGDDPNENLQKTSAQTTLMKLFNGFGKMQLVSEPQTGWRQSVAQFDSLYQNDLQTGVIKKATPLVYDSWRGAQIEYYFCRDENKTMIGLGELSELHQYAWMNNERKEKVNMESAYYILSSEDYSRKQTFQKYYTNIDSITTIYASRRPRPDLFFRIYRLSGWKNNLPVED